jgi:hypothetical protein
MSSQVWSGRGHLTALEYYSRDTAAAALISRCPSVSVSSRSGLDVTGRDARDGLEQARYIFKTAENNVGSCVL